MLREEELIGGLNFRVLAIQDVCAQDLVTEFYKELRSRRDLEQRSTSEQSIAARCG